MLTKENLIAFEEQVAARFNSGHIRSPVHLSDGNEETLINIFKTINPTDWVCSSWRSHLHAILHGIPVDVLMDQIMEGRSITINSKKHRFISSAIVGGIVPIAVGLALGIKRAGGSEKVYCFIGDMTAHTGIVHECFQYAAGHDLPIGFVIEDNGKSVCTNTKSTWGKRADPNLLIYSYSSKWPHAGAGKRVQF